MYLHIAPRKVRLVANMLKGMDVRRAQLALQNMPKRASGPLEKLLKSAIKNAELVLNADASALYVQKITVDAGPMVKRMMPRAFGRGAPIRKRMSHVSIVLGVRGEETKNQPKVKKAAKPEVRIAEWEEVKGEQDTTRTSSRILPAMPKKKSRGFGGKKTFTRKVI